jgi:PhzF family phenazine biosynthesis protein
MTTMKLTAYKINAFTNTCTGGNPAGLVINPPQLTDDQMKRITIRLQVSETAFLQPSNHADYHVRFFAPEMEVDLCGHATIATFYTLATKGYLTIETGIIRLTQETNVGILPIEITMDHGKPTQVMMIQTTPIIKDLSYSYKEIASILNIKSTDIDTSLPKQMVSTGLFTLPICIRSFNTLKKIKPDYTKIKSFCQLHESNGMVEPGLKISFIELQHFGSPWKSSCIGGESWFCADGLPNPHIARRRAENSDLSSGLRSKVEIRQSDIVSEPSVGVKCDMAQSSSCPVWSRLARL